MDNDILTYQKLEKIFPNLNLFIIKNIVLSAIEKANYFTNDFRLMNIILHLCITIDRLSNANTIEIRQEEARNDQDFDDRNMELARQILGLLSNEFGFQFNESEVVYLSLMLSLNIYDEETKSITAANIDRFVSASSLEFVEKMMREIDERYAINLDKGDFKLRFSLHLNSLLSKSKHPKNPMLENIKSSYPIVFEIAVFVSDMIQTEFDISLNIHDISFIALHIGISIEVFHHEMLRAAVMNFDYHSLTESLVNKLNSIFNNDLNLSVISSFEQIKSSKTDFIISTLNISEEDCDLPIVTITPFVTDDDIRLIANKISFLRNRLTRVNFEFIQRFFRREYFRVIQDPSSLSAHDIITQITQPLIEDKIENQQFIDNVLYREELSSTSYKNIAIPHSISFESQYTIISVLLLPQRMKWGSNHVNTVLLLAISKDYNERFRAIFEYLLKIFTSERWNVAVKNIETYDDFIFELKNFKE